MYDILEISWLRILFDISQTTGSWRDQTWSSGIRWNGQTMWKCENFDATALYLSCLMKPVTSWKCHSWQVCNLRYRGADGGILSRKKPPPIEKNSPSGILERCEAVPRAWQTRLANIILESQPARLWILRGGTTCRDDTYRFTIPNSFLCYFLSLLYLIVAIFSEDTDSAYMAFSNSDWPLLMKRDLREKYHILTDYLNEYHPDKVRVMAPLVFLH